MGVGDASQSHAHTGEGREGVAGEEGGEGEAYRSLARREKIQIRKHAEEVHNEESQVVRSDEAGVVGKNRYRRNETARMERGWGRKVSRTSCECRTIREFDLLLYTSYSLRSSPSPAAARSRQFNSFDFGHNCNAPRWGYLGVRR